MTTTQTIPGKAGRKPTGLKRRIPHLLQLSQDEFEYLRRRVAQIEKTFKDKTNVSKLIRALVFIHGWENELHTLREIQGANIP